MGRRGGGMFDDGSGTGVKAAKVPFFKVNVNLVLPSIVSTR